MAIRIFFLINTKINKSYVTIDSPICVRAFASQSADAMCALPIATQCFGFKDEVPCSHTPLPLLLGVN